MSLRHSTIVGHFDVYALAFCPRNLIPTRPIDETRVKEILTRFQLSIEDGITITSDFVEFEGSLSRIAELIAQSEQCLIASMGGPPIEVIHPPDDVERFKRLSNWKPLSWSQIDGSLMRNDIDELRALAVHLIISDCEWAPRVCLELMKHESPNVRGNAVFALGQIGRRDVTGNCLEIMRETIQSVVASLIEDSHRYVSRMAVFTAGELESNQHWVFPHFDNDRDVMSAVRRSDGWTCCPHCNLTFATYDPWAFRENRCMRCRQKIDSI